jgi:hypothetical protein
MRLPSVVALLASSLSVSVSAPAIGNPKIVQAPPDCHAGDGSCRRSKNSVRSSPSSGSVYYRNCAEARAAGAAPIHRGEPGYAAHLDRDRDGIACEPYRRR